MLLRGVRNYPHFRRGPPWVTLWNVDDHVGVFSDHADYQHTFRYSVTISPDNQFLYLYSADFSQQNNVLHVWDIGRQREVDRTEFCAVYVLRGYEALCDTGVSAPGYAFMDLTTFGTVSTLPVSEIRFRLDRYALSPDGRLFAFYFLYVENEQPVNTYYLLDLDTQEIIQRRAVTYIADSYAAPVGRFTINPSGELLIYQDGNLMKLVDAMAGDVLISFASQRSWDYNYVQFSPDGTLLALGDFPQDGIDIYAVAACYVTSDRVVNLRSGPGTEFDNPNTMEPGKRLAVRDELQDGDFTWYHLGIGWWVRGDLVKTHGSC
jgi:WD40 repeat protein